MLPQLTYYGANNGVGDGSSFGCIAHDEDDLTLYTELGDFGERDSGIVFNRADAGSGYARGGNEAFAKFVQVHISGCGEGHGNAVRGQQVHECRLGDD